MDCTHERTRFPERPVPDASYRCPDCGERVSLRGGRIWTVRELQDRLTRRNRVEDELATAARALDLDELERLAPIALAALSPYLGEQPDTRRGRMSKQDPKLIACLWATCHDGRYPPQFVGAVSESLQDAWYEESERLREAAEAWFLDFGDGDRGEWTFHVTHQRIDVPSLSLVETRPHA